MRIAQATIDDLEVLAPLFDAYRQFYEQTADLTAARGFLLQRFQQHDSVVFVAREGERAVGFTQLYPTYSSIGCARVYVLNDLYVEPDHRGRGVGVALLDAACEYGRRVGAGRLTLSTSVDNLRAQGVYEGAGWKRSDGFVTYEYAL